MTRERSLGNRSIKDLGHVRRGIPKFGTERREGSQRRDGSKGEGSSIMPPNRVLPLLGTRKLGKIIVVADCVLLFVKRISRDFSPVFSKTLRRYLPDGDCKRYLYVQSLRDLCICDYNSELSAVIRSAVIFIWSSAKNLD